MLRSALARLGIIKINGEGKKEWLHIKQGFWLISKVTGQVINEFFFLPEFLLKIFKSKSFRTNLPPPLNRTTHHVIASERHSQRVRFSLLLLGRSPHKHVRAESVPLEAL